MVPTPTPIPIEGEIGQYIQFGRTFGELGFGLGLLFLGGLIVLAFIIWTLVNRKKTPVTDALSEVIALLRQQIENKDTEIDEISAEKEEQERQFTAGLTVIGEAMNRIADTNDRHAELMAQVVQAGSQQTLDMTAIKTALDEMVNLGSQPLRKMAVDVSQVLSIAQNLNGKVPNWEELLKFLPEIRAILSVINQQLGGALAAAVEEKRRATQPLPTVNPEPEPST